MVWNFSWSENVKKRACRYLLQRYIGQFLAEKLTLEQLHIDIFSGKSCIKEISLDVEVLNALVVSNNLPFEFVSGYIESVSVTIPWASFLTASSSVEVHGLTLVLRTCSFHEECDVFESMFESMTSSTVDMARDCVQQQEWGQWGEGGERHNDISSDRHTAPSGDAGGGTGVASTGDYSSTVDVVENIASVIDTVLLRVCALFLNTRIIFHQETQHSILSFQIHIDRMDYYDEVGRELLGENREEQKSADWSTRSQTNQSSHFVYSAKRLVLGSVRCYVGEMTAGGASATTAVRDHQATCGYNYNVQNLPNYTGDAYATTDLLPLIYFYGYTTLRFELDIFEQNTSRVKFDIDIETQSIGCVIMPQHIHKLSLLVSNLTPSINNQTRAREQKLKPMTREDFQLIEDRLISAQDYRDHDSISQMDGLDTKIENLNFVSMTQSSDENYFSDDIPASTNFLKTTGSVSTNSASSFISSAKLTDSGCSYSRRHRNRGYNSGSFEDTLRLKFKCSSFVCILLYEDILRPSFNQSVSMWKYSSESVDEFFDYMRDCFLFLGNLTVPGRVEIKSEGRQSTSLYDTRLTIIKRCSRNHICLMVSSLSVVYNHCVKDNVDSNYFTVIITAANFYLYEHLLDTQTQQCSTNEIISFEHGLLYSKQRDVCDDIKTPLLTFECHALPTSKHIEYSLETHPLFIEVDVSLLDRLCKLMCNSEIYLNEPNQASFFHSFNRKKEHSNGDFHFKLNIARLIINLRFPVIDFNNEMDLDSFNFYFSRQVREDSFIFDLSNFSCAVVWHFSKFQDFSSSSSNLLTFETKFLTFRLFYLLDADFRNLQILAQSETEFGLKRKCFLTVRIRSFDQNFEMLGERFSSTNNQPFFKMSNLGNCFPFCKNRVFIGSIADESKNLKDLQLKDEFRNDSMNLDFQKTKDFVQKICKKCLYLFELEFETLELLVPSKNIFELIYNRIANDFTLWEPLFFKFLSDKQSFSKNDFYPCQTDNDSRTDSVPDNVRQAKPCLGAMFVLCIHISRLSASIFTHRQSLHSDDIYVDEMRMDAVDFNSIVCTKYRMVDNSCYACIFCKQIQLFQSNDMYNQDRVAKMPSVNSPNAELDRILYSAFNESFVNNSRTAGSPQSASCAFLFAQHFSLDDTVNVKKFSTSINFDHCYVHYSDMPVELLFVTRLIDLCDVTDIDVPGYTPPHTLSELHVNLSSLTLLYRPVTLSYACSLHLNTLTISSYIIPRTSVTVFRALLDEIYLSVCTVVADSSATCSAAAATPECPDVPILRVDLLELYVRVHQPSDSTQPEEDTPPEAESIHHVTRTGGKRQRPVYDWSIYNNRIEMRVCADSLCAFSALLTHFIEALTDKQMDGESAYAASCCHDDEATPSLVLNNSGSCPTISKSLLSDALTESIVMTDIDNSHAPCSVAADIQLYYFPDETRNNIGVKEDSSIHTPIVKCSTLHGNEVDCSRKRAVSSPIDDYFLIKDNANHHAKVSTDSDAYEIRHLTTRRVRVIEDYFVPVNSQQGADAPFSAEIDIALYPPAHLPTPLTRIHLKQLNLYCTICDGLDFSSHTSLNAVNRVKFSKIQGFVQPLSFGTLNTERRRERPFNSLQHRFESGGCSRSKARKIEFQLLKIRCQQDIYPAAVPVQQTASGNSRVCRRLALAVRSVLVLDRLQSSQVNKLLSQYSASDSPTTHSFKDMFHLKALISVPEPSCPLRQNRDDGGDEDSTSTELQQQQEFCDLRVTLAPIRLNLDQDTLTFLHNFSASVENIITSDEIRLSTTVQQSRCHDTMEDGVSSSATFFRNVIFGPDAVVRIDYQGKHVDTNRMSPLLAFIVGFGQLNCCELRLCKVVQKNGLLGIRRVLQHLALTWIADIRNNQIPALVRGFGPMHSILQLIQGVCDLIYLPIEQYSRDGRLVFGMRRGLYSFSHSTVTALLTLVGKLFSYIQFLSEIAFDLLSPGLTVRDHRRNRHFRRKFFTQRKVGSNLNMLASDGPPRDFRDGVVKAVDLITQGLEETAYDISRVVNEQRERRGLTAAMGGVLRQIPPTVVAPILLASEATNTVIDGAQSQMCPELKQEAYEKWRSSQS